ncbi:MAG: pantoate--beta-alanine ligase [Actinomycetia bacterium]|nr:pantoate--beta-alanine ligase [Actinomycetes bacterium]
MITVTTIAELRVLLDAHRGNGHSVGFVPTMGYLHDGHASLMRAARVENDVVVTSIFVNPLQFAEDEDLSDYPRDLERDLQVCDEAGADVIFAPTADEMYSRPMSTVVEVPEMAKRWEGASRPTHFAGVATVVAKLFSIVGTCSAYFGEKDFQQLRIITTMVEDLSFPIRVVGCPIRREDDGLAMSSRNIYLEGDQRAAATVLNRALRAAIGAFHNGETDGAVLSQLMASEVTAEPLAALDYAAVVRSDDLTTARTVDDTNRLIIAADVGATRLIDNMGLGSTTPL